MPPIIHPPNLPLRPYLDDIWDVLTGFDGDFDDIGDDITNIQTDITNIQNDIQTIQDECCGDDGGGGFSNIDGGTAGSIYLITQVADGGGA